MTGGRHAAPRGRSARSVGRGTWVAAAGVSLLVAGAVLGLGGAGIGPFVHHGKPLLAAPAGAEPGPSPTAPALPEPAPSPGTQPFATVRGLHLYLPSDTVVRIGYHEASFPVALALTPLGRCLRDFNRTKFRKPPTTAGADYLVMSSRGRRDAATSAADVALLPGTAVLAPTTGVVTSAKAYRLYGRYRDMRIAIRPDGARGIVVVMIHVDHVAVHRGDRVFAGVTPIGVPRIFAFSSQVNDYIGPGIPHVHIEVNTIGPARHETSD